MILCIIHQWLWSRAHDSKRPVPEFTRKHLLKCTICRKMTDSMRSMDDSLRLPDESVSEEWHEALMSEIQRIPPPLRKSVPVMRPLPLALVGMATVLVLALLLRDSAPPPDAAYGFDSTLSSSMATLEELASSLENESDALEQDAIYAARMATACLPF